MKGVQRCWISAVWGKILFRRQGGACAVFALDESKDFADLDIPLPGGIQDATYFS